METRKPRGSPKSWLGRHDANGLTRWGRIARAELSSLRLHQPTFSVVVAAQVAWHEPLLSMGARDNLELRRWLGLCHALEQGDVGEIRIEPVAVIVG